jgi:alpha-N-arabinofuranosidase
MGLLVLTVGTQAQETVIEIGSPTGEVINRNIYGQFAEHLGRCVYDGFYRNGKIRMDIVEALKKIRIPLLRWPGGCFADDYHWRDGIGPLAKRAKTVNIMWGMIPENNSFGTGEFLQLCQLIGCEPYMAGNMGTGTPEELESWVEYCNFQGPSDLSVIRAANGHPAPYHVKYWGIGNESWGCGGRMTPETYVARYRTFANYIREYPGAPVARIASGAQDDDYNWTEYLMSHISLRWMQGIGVHYYTDAGGRTEEFATAFNNAQYFNSLKSALRMERIIAGHAAIMDRYDPGKKVALIIDEWGMVVGDENSRSYFYQQNSLRDALTAASTLNIFNNHCDRVKMANLAQAVNVLQSLVLTSGDSMALTPTYYVFDLYKVHQDARWLPLELSWLPYYQQGTDSIPAINASASVDSNGVIHVSLVNLDPERNLPIRLDFGNRRFSTIRGQVLTSQQFTDINTFDHPGKVINEPFSDFNMSADVINVNMPTKAIVILEIK